ncbi:DUF3553 domain-containing protein [Thermosulfuriphilus sp.]
MKARIDYENLLNPAQYEAVTTLYGPLLVIAGAGSGKTRTLVYRMARLVEEGVAPENILLLTFTRKAATEMLRRAAALLSEGRCEEVIGGTFHSLSHLMLREYGGLLGLSRHFTILDRGDAEDAINLLRNALGFSERGRRFPKKETIAAIFSKAVNKMLSLGEIIEAEYPHLLGDVEDLARLFRHYVQYKLEHQLLDYDDLLVYWRRILVEFPQVREAVAERFRFIMVDEYQDTNFLQAEIVRFMAEGHENVMVVGDDSQSIYSFRGANFRNILEFPRLFPGAKIIKLEENYRSTQPILDLANAVIAKAKEKYTKCLFTKNSGGEPPVVFRGRDEAEQSRFVAQRILELREEGIDLSDIAVLFRSSYHSFDLELELAKRDLPFVKHGGMKLIETAHIKDVIAHLRVILNPLDMLSWNRILLLIEGVGPKTSQQIINYLRYSSEPIEALAGYPAKAAIREGILRLSRTLTAMAQKGFSPEEQLEILSEYYLPILSRVYHDDYPKREKDLEHLLSIVGRYETLEDFLADLALEPPEASVAAVEPYETDKECLVLSTIHSAKGLEWHTVFVISLVEGRFPSGYSLSREEDLEEERRLFYVAVTRARERLFLTYPGTIYIPGEGRTIAKPSRFLVELPAKLSRNWHDLSERQPAVLKESPPFLEASAPAFQPGEWVKHPVFGAGQVRGMADQDKVIVNFEAAGTKTLHLKYVKLERLAP